MRADDELDLPSAELGMYVLRSSRALRGDFRLSLGDDELVTVRYAALLERAASEHDDRKFTCTGGVIGSRFRLRMGRETLSTARRNWSLRRFEVEGSDRVFRMESESRGWSSYVVRDRDDDRKIGRLEREELSGRRALIQLPVTMPLPLKVFFCYLAVVGWRRTNRAILGVIRPG